MANLRLKGVIGYMNNAETASREGSLIDHERFSSESDQRYRVLILREKLEVFAKYSCKVRDIGTFLALLSPNIS